MKRTVAPIAQDRLQRISAEAWELLETRGEFVEGDSGDIMIEAGAQIEDIAIVLSGKITLYITRSDKLQPTGVYRYRPDILHHAGLHLGTPNPFQLRAAEDGTRLVILDKKTVFDIAEADISFTKYLLKDLSVRVLIALDYLREQREEPLLLRLAKRLLTIAGTSDSIAYTQAEIAEFLAVTRISISKGLKTLEDMGLVERAERSLIIIRRAELSAWVKSQQD